VSTNPVFIRRPYLCVVGLVMFTTLLVLAFTSLFAFPPLIAFAAVVALTFRALGLRPALLALLLSGAAILIVLLRQS
jgi:hypothetical protein